MNSKLLFISVLLILVFPSCSTSPGLDALSDVDLSENPDIAADLAEVLSVEVSGEEGRYTFSVEVSSPDTGCDQYADWWEVVGEDGTLKYRRILAHSHVNEQPFKRSGGTVPIQSDEFVYVRAHMNNSGYGIRVMGGTVDTGLVAKQLSIEFAEDLNKMEPLPKNCAF